MREKNIVNEEIGMRNDERRTIISSGFLLYAFFFPVRLNYEF
jgi:hypothetical protein